MGHSVYFLVRARHGDFSPRHFVSGEQAAGLERLSWSAGLWGKVDLRPIPFPFAPTSRGKRCSFRYVLWPAVVRRRTEIIVLGSSYSIEEGFISGRGKSRCRLRACL